MIYVEVKQFSVKLAEQNYSYIMCIFLLPHQMMWPDNQIGHTETIYIRSEMVLSNFYKNLQ